MELSSIWERFAWEREEKATTDYGLGKNKKPGKKPVGTEM